MSEEKFKVIVASTLKQLISSANNMDIKKSEYIDIKESKGQYFLIYYKD